MIPVHPVTNSKGCLLGNSNALTVLTAAEVYNWRHIARNFEWKNHDETDLHNFLDQSQ